MTGHVAPVQRSSLRQQIADALRDEMLTGRLPAGDRFTVKEIAELYEVSATPVREALVDLAAQGLLEVQHHRGFMVRRLTLSDFEDIVAARVLVTQGVFRRVMGEADRDWPDAVLTTARRRAEAATRAVLAGELDVLIGCDLRFWRELNALIGNRHIGDFLDRLRVQSWLYTVPLLRGQRDLAALWWHDHVPLVDALSAGELKRAQDLIGEFHSGSLELMRRLEGSGPGRQPR
ncbi:hypothetical protein GCM10027168_15110 [Streptomyces capparidis]